MWKNIEEAHADFTKLINLLGITASDLQFKKPPQRTASSSGVWASLQEAYEWVMGYVGSLEGVNSITQIAQGAGVFRVNDLLTGNSGDPRDSTDPYTGTFMVYPPITLPNGDTADIGGMNAGVIQWYGNSTNGKFYTAAGEIVQDSTGIHLTAPVFPDATYVDWLADSAADVPGAVLGALLGWYVDGVASGWYALGKGMDANHYGVAGMAAMAHGQSLGEYKALFEVTSNGTANLDLTQVNGGVGAQSLTIKTKTSGTNALNVILNLLTQSTGAPAAGLGTVINFLVEDSAGQDQQAGYIGAEHTDVTNGSEDSRIAVGRMKAGTLENGYFDWGTYSPSLTNTTNVAASTAYTCQWMRVGNVVTVSGMFDVDPTAAAGTILEISLPVASNFGSLADCGGTAVATAVASEAAGIRASAANNRALVEWVTVSTANHNMAFTFTYVVI